MSENVDLNRRSKEIKERMRRLDILRANIGGNYTVGQKNPFDAIAEEEKALLIEYCNLPEYVAPMKFRRLDVYESLDGSIRITMRDRRPIIETGGFYDFRIEAKDNVPVAKLDKFIDSYVRQQRNRITPIEVLEERQIRELEDAEIAKLAARPKPEPRKDIPTWLCTKCSSPNLAEPLVSQCHICGAPRPKEERKSEGVVGRLKGLLQ